jgi:hypothetical protein
MRPLRHVSGRSVRGEDSFGGPMDRRLLFVPLFLSLIAFLAVGASELRAGGKAGETPWRLLPSVLGLLAFSLFLKPQALGVVTPERSVLLSYIMTMLSAAIACSGIFIAYSRRRNAAWIACAGLILAFMWMVFGQAYY